MGMNTFIYVITFPGPSKAEKKLDDIWQYATSNNYTLM